MAIWLIFYMYVIIIFLFWGFNCSVFDICHCISRKKFSPLLDGGGAFLGWLLYVEVSGVRWFKVFKKQNWTETGWLVIKTILLFVSSFSVWAFCDCVTFQFYYILNMHGQKPIIKYLMVFVCIRLHVRDFIFLYCCLFVSSYCGMMQILTIDHLDLQFVCSKSYHSCILQNRQLFISYCVWFHFYECKILVNAIFVMSPCSLHAYLGNISI